MSVEAMRWMIHDVTEIEEGAYVLGLVLAWRHIDDVMRIRLADLCSDAHMSVSTVKRHLATLGAMGLISYEAARGRGTTGQITLHVGIKASNGEYYSEKRPHVNGFSEEKRSINRPALNGYHESTFKQKNTKALTRGRAAQAGAGTRASDVEAFNPSPKLFIELINRGFPEVEWDGMLDDYRRTRKGDDDPLTDANFRKYALWYMRVQLHVPDHGDLSQRRIGPKTADVVHAALAWSPEKSR